MKQQVTYLSSEETIAEMGKLLKSANAENAAQFQRALKAKGHNHNYQKLHRWVTGQTSITTQQMHALQTQLGIKL